MSKRFTLGAAEVAGKAREAFGMALLREHRVSQGKRPSFCA